MSSNFALWFAKQGFASQRADFFQDLAEALEDKGVLVEIIRNLENRAKSRKDTIAPLYTLWLRRMDDRSFAQSLIGTVPDSDVMILEAAESSNNLIGGLRFLAKAIRAAETMQKELRKAVAGPIFLLIMFIGMLVGFSLYLVPVLTQIMKPSTWPWSGQMLYAVSQFITGYGYWLLGALVIVGVAFTWSLPRWTGRWRSFADKYVPLYAIYRDYVGSIFLVSLASLMQSGEGLSESLNALAARGSPWLRWHIRRIQGRLDTNAEHPAEAFDTGVFNRALTDRVIDYGQRSAFHDALGKVGIASIEKVTEFVSGSATLLNRILILVCGATMIFMVMGVMLTAQEAQNAIQRQTFKAL